MKNKKYKKVAELVEKGKMYEIDEALELLPKVSTSKFVGTAELLVNFKLNEKQKKETVRGSVVFPKSFGKSKVVLVLADESKAKEALAAGADFAGLEEYVKKIEGGWIDFDVVIATMKVMPQIAKLGKYLGRRGLMPNPKNQTVTDDVAKVIKMYKSGKKDFKKGDDDSIKIAIGKVDMKKEDLKANFEEFVKSINPYIKKFGSTAVKNVSICPTMGPSIKLNPRVLA
jgi:large subunit ribosomal protein L1